MSRLIWSDEARHNLEETDAYLSQFDPAVAEAMLRAILDTTSILARFPAIGPALEAGTRSLRVRHTPYALIYRIEPDGISLLHVRHTRQDWRA